MAEGFDLRDEPWIPVRLGGCSSRVGLRELFYRAHEIEDIELPVPPAASGLLRVLAAMTSRIAGSGGVPLCDEDEAENADDWFGLRERILERERFETKAVDAYFDDEALGGRFDLFDAQRPFLQDPRLRAECVDPKGKPNPSGINKLVMGRPTGINGAVLFGHFSDTAPVAVSAAEAAWHLIATLYYGPSGQCTPRRITTVRTGSGDAGPLRKTISFHAWAPDLFTTLLLAVPTPGSGAEGPDSCPWEEEKLPDPLGTLASFTWPGRMLTGRARHAVLLMPSADHTQVVDAYVSWSTHQPPPAVRDPHVILDMPRTGDGAPYARMADGQRALWRDLDALLLVGDSQTQRPSTLDHLPRALAPTLRVRAYGFDQDGQQRDSIWFEATTPPVLTWQQHTSPEATPYPGMAEYVARCHRAAEEVADKLQYAARLAWKLATDPGEDPSGKVKLDPKKYGPWASLALTRYWRAAEETFWDLADPQRIDTPPHPPFVRIALDALDEAIGARSADVRVARARNRARTAIRSALPKPPPTAPGE
ncbi:type I-E CRISPR-associated protein Cse1/CasA [Streptomyces sp. NPDC059215]|uniref:type I-E CRISPR-associated protein Cse1/CasA n=1 Tax=Streptomyces sp. NPDC059215 TaxID=3346772 RepID=UPI00367D45DD